MDRQDYDPQDAMPDFRILSDRKHTARSPKACETCEGSIMPGERYRKIVALDEGRFAILCTHEDRDACAAMVGNIEAWRRQQYEAAPLGPNEVAF